MFQTTTNELKRFDICSFGKRVTLIVSCWFSIGAPNFDIKGAKFHVYIKGKLPVFVENSELINCFQTLQMAGNNNKETEFRKTPFTT